LFECKIIAIAGGSCSGKTTMANSLVANLGPENCAVLYQDSYYRGLENITNYDVPEAIEFELIAEHLHQLKRGQQIDMPVYDFKTHRRKSATQTLVPKPIVFVDGILILHALELRDSFDLKIFVECEERYRKERRLVRDISERGRSKEEIEEQFESQVAPLHNEYVEPSKQYADIICHSNQERVIDSAIMQELMTYCENTIALR